MRIKRTSQISIFDQFAEHEIDRELLGMSALLDAHLQLLDGVAEDLGCAAATGRCGLSAESALRCALLKQYRQLSYEELAFHLQDSLSFQAFARLPRGWAPRRAALQANIAAISATTWEEISQHLLGAGAKLAWNGARCGGWTARWSTAPFTHRATVACCSMGFGSWCGCCRRAKRCPGRRCWTGTTTAGGRKSAPEPSAIPGVRRTIGRCTVTSSR